MKKKIIYITFIILFIVTITIKQNILPNKTETKQNDIPTINDDTISFYKQENASRYLDYKEKNPNLSEKDIITHVNIGLDHEFYTNTKKATNTNTNYIIVNKYNYLDKNYVPNNLEKINSIYSSKEIYLVKDAKTSFENMAKHASEEGYKIRCISAYRSYTYQENLYNNYVKKDGVQKADTYSSRPGFSEHQTGLVVDIDNTILPYTSFINTKEYEWMKNNAYKYGFILRYPKDKESITGYSFEPWHYRYVGEEIAAYIHYSNLTFEEYYVRFINN